MKRILSIVCCLLIGWIGLHAQAQFRVYRFEGKVQYRLAQSDSPWKNLKEDLVLSPSDLLRMPQGARVRLIDSDRNVITLETEGVYTLATCTDMAKNNRSIRILLGNIFKWGDSKNKKKVGESMKVLGGVARGEKPSIDYAQLAEHLVWIAGQACDKRVKSPKPQEISFKRIELKSDDLLDFILVNNTDKDYHLNVLHVNKKSHTVSLCYVITQEVQANACPITPGGCCACEMDVLFPNTKDDVYVLFASEEAFDTEALNISLHSYRTDTAKNQELNILYTWEYVK